MFRTTWSRIGLIAGLLVAITMLHYITNISALEHHAVHRRLYYLPLVLAAFWFGIKGAISLSAVASALYLPSALPYSEDSFLSFVIFLEFGLYLFIALTLGFLSEREQKEHLARIEAERFAAIGKAVSEIAHDMKSPLMAIGGFVSQVSRKMSRDEVGRRKLQVVIQETARLERMVKDMLEFGKPIELSLSRANLKDLVSEIVEVLKPVAAEAGVELKAELDGSMQALNLDAFKVKQVLMNLIVNAIQASSSGGEILVRTGRSGLEEIIEVRDSGCGIPEGDREKIFQPFFSTKKQGTGLGLPIVKKIVEAHQGRLTFRPNKDKGTIFVVALPSRLTGGKA